MKIKPEYLGTVIGFGNSGLPLGERSTEEIKELAKLAQESKDPTLLKLFEGKVPSAEVIKGEQVDAKLKDLKANNNTPNETPNSNVTGVKK